MPSWKYGAWISGTTHTILRNTVVEMPTQIECNQKLCNWSQAQWCTAVEKQQPVDLCKFKPNYSYIVRTYLKQAKQWKYCTIWACFGSTHAKTGSIQRRVTWPLCEHDTHLWSGLLEWPWWLTLPLTYCGFCHMCIGSRIHIVMKSDKEINGTLLGFDDLVKMVLKDARVWNYTSRKKD